MPECSSTYAVSLSIPELSYPVARLFNFVHPLVPRALPSSHIPSARPAFSSTTSVLPSPSPASFSSTGPAPSLPVSPETGSSSHSLPSNISHSAPVLSLKSIALTFSITLAEDCNRHPRMYSLPSAAARYECAVPCEKCPSCTGVGAGFSMVDIWRDGAGREGKSRAGTKPDIGAGFGRLDDTTGSATRSCQRFLPIAHTSSHDVLPTGRPWVWQTHAISHASNVTASTNIPYAAASSFANTESFRVKCRGRGRREARWSKLCDAEGLLFEEWDGVELGYGTSRSEYEAPGEKMVGKG